MWLKFVNFVNETHTCSYSVCVKMLGRLVLRYH